MLLRRALLSAGRSIHVIEYVLLVYCHIIWWSRTVLRVSKRLNIVPCLKLLLRRKHVLIIISRKIIRMRSFLGSKSRRAILDNQCLLFFVLSLSSHVVLKRPRSFLVRSSLFTLKSPLSKSITRASLTQIVRVLEIHGAKPINNTLLISKGKWSHVHCLLHGHHDGDAYWEDGRDHKHKQIDIIRMTGDAMHGAYSRKLFNLCEAVYAEGGQDGPIKQEKHIDYFPGDPFYRFIRQLQS